MELIIPDPGLLVWTTALFLLLVFVLAKFAWGPIMSALRDREKFIEDALSAAEKARAEMLELKSENEKLLHEARLERDRILKEAQTVAVTLINEAKEKANLEGAKMVENARLQINTEKNAALTELKNLVAITSLQIAELVLKKDLSGDLAQKELIEKYIKDAKLN